MAMAMHRVTPPGVCVLARLDRLLLAPKPPDDGVDGVERELVGRPRAAVDPRQETQHGAAPPAARVLAPKEKPCSARYTSCHHQGGTQSTSPGESTTS